MVRRTDVEVKDKKCPICNKPLFQVSLGQHMMTSHPVKPPLHGGGGCFGAKTRPLTDGEKLGEKMIKELGLPLATMVAREMKNMISAKEK